MVIEEELRPTVPLLWRLAVDFFQLIFAFVAIPSISVFRRFVKKPRRSLAGEVALVTGAGHGIGRELALQLAALGARVVCWDIDQIACNMVAKKALAQGGEAWAFRCNVGDREDVATTATLTRKTIGRPITMLFNNAGILDPCKPLLSQKPPEVERIFRVNALSHFWTLMEFLPDLTENGGHVVAMSSTAALTGTPNMTSYCATKCAISGLMEALFFEHRQLFPNKPLRTTTVYPFTINTGLAKRPTARFLSLTPFTSPEDAARMILDGVRRNETHIYIPKHFEYLFSITHVLPFRLKVALQDFLGCGVLPHDT